MTTRHDPFLAHRRRRPWWRRLVTMTPEVDIVTYDIRSPRWQAAPLNIACLSDIHAMRPWMPLSALERHVDEVNAMGADIIMLLGDYQSPHHTPGPSESIPEQAKILARLDAPLGVHAILGNHDWVDDPVAQDQDFQTSEISQALTAEGLRPLINTSRRITHESTDIWVVGMDSQTADSGPDGEIGRHDPEQAFGEVPDESLAILLAHEPDYFVFGDKRPVLQLSGHTHGGQGQLFGWRPMTPSEYPTRYAYGHVIEDGQHLVVSGGMGYTHIPMRVMQPSEITLVRLSGENG